jgi:hypothetical protein
MVMMNLNKEYADVEDRRIKERKNKEYDDLMARQHDKNMLSMRGKQDVNLQQVADQGQMARAMLSNQIDKERVGIERERLQNEGYNYATIQDQNGNETVNVYRRGKLLNPAETFGDNDAAALMTPEAPGGGGESLTGHNYVQDAGGNRIGVSPSGEITHTNPVIEKIMNELGSSPMRRSSRTETSAATPRTYSLPDFGTGGEYTQFYPLASRAAKAVGGAAKRAAGKSIRELSKTRPYRNF